MYIVSRGGTFGVLERSYRASDGTPMVIIRWGRLGWLTPVRQDDTRLLTSAYESEAREEAARWLEAG